MRMKRRRRKQSSRSYVAAKIRVALQPNSTRRLFTWTVPCEVHSGIQCDLPLASVLGTAHRIPGCVPVAGSNCEKVVCVKVQDSEAGHGAPHSSGYCGLLGVV
jgi:hypothetical protein